MVLTRIIVTIYSQFHLKGNTTMSASLKFRHAISEIKIKIFSARTVKPLFGKQSIVSVWYAPRVMA